MITFRFLFPRPASLEMRFFFLGEITYRSLAPDNGARFGQTGGVACVLFGPFPTLPFFKPRL